MRRIGVMGGTFDPIHHGHLVAASEVAHIFALDEVIFVPTGQPYQKGGRQVSPAEDRYLMTVIATAANPRFSVSRVDIDRGGPTYTKDTLSDLAALNPDAFPEPDWLEQLLATAGRHDAEAVASLQLDDADPAVLDGAGDSMSIFGIGWRGGYGFPRSAAPTSCCRSRASATTRS